SILQNTPFQGVISSHHEICKNSLPSVFHATNTKETPVSNHREEDPTGTGLTIACHTILIPPNIVSRLSDPRFDEDTHLGSWAVTDELLHPRVRGSRSNCRSR